MGKRRILSVMLVLTLLLAVPVAIQTALCQSYDIRGPWVGNAKGSIFGAEGTVTITRQQGERIQGIVEGGNFLGKAKFSIDGVMRGNYIFGTKEGHTFHGFLYADGAIRGQFIDSDGDKYRIFLRRPFQQWGVPYERAW